MGCLLRRYLTHGLQLVAHGFKDAYQRFKNHCRVLGHVISWCSDERKLLDLQEQSLNHFAPLYVPIYPEFLIRLDTGTSNMGDYLPKPLHNLLLSQPRTCSNLLTRILNLSSQPNIYKHPGDGYFFMSILAGRWPVEKARSSGLVPDGDEVDYTAILKGCVKSMETWVTELEEHQKCCFVKEHVSWIIHPSREQDYRGKLDVNGQQKIDLDDVELYGNRSFDNDTVLPDSLLKAFRPSFLIRHPALAFPSMLRACRDAEMGSEHEWSLNYHWSRRLYTWYCEHLSVEEKKSAIEGVQYPIILDADDIQDRALVERYSEAIGLDKSLLAWTWSEATTEEMKKQGPVVARFKDTLMNSQGLIRSKSAGTLDIGIEKGKWKEEFGEETAIKLGSLVDQAWEDYMWLRSQRMRSGDGAVE